MGFVQVKKTPLSVNAAGSNEPEVILFILYQHDAFML